MRIYKEPKRDSWAEIIRRPSIDNEELSTKLDAIFDTVKREGDAALIRYSEEFDHIAIDDVVVPFADEEAEGATLPITLKLAIDQAYDTIYRFHAAQTQHDISMPIETAPGVACWRKPQPIDKVGLYIPGGSAPLISTAMMLGIPARLAGCQDIIMCTPPMPDGTIHPAIRYIAAKVGVRELYRTGGAQAIAAMVFGTESIAPVNKIFGPGNQFVTGAKERVWQYGVAIDMPAGPSEVMVMADMATNAVYAAADLLSQAEHGKDSQVMLVATNAEVAEKIGSEVMRQVMALPRHEIASTALEQSCAVILSNTQDAMDFANTYAPEHLIISTEDCHDRVPMVRNAGSVFVGHYTPESAGDYASGTNHTLPTNAWARSYGGVSVDSFRRYVTYQEITKKGIEQLGSTIVTLAEAEGLEAHARAVRVRIDPLEKKG